MVSKKNVVVLSSLRGLEPLNDTELHALYTWIDGIPLSRPKRSVGRDFADGVLAAEVVKHYFPKYVELHSFTSVNSTAKKMENWFLLNRKVFKLLSFELSEEVIRSIATGREWSVEYVLIELRNKIEEHLVYKNNRDSKMSDRPEVDQVAGLSPRPQKYSNSSSSVISPSRRPLPPPTVIHETNDPSLNDGKPTYRGVGEAAQMVSKAELDDKEAESMAKEETIQILQAKVQRLEHLLHLKDLRIEDLQSKVEALRPSAGHKR